MEDREKLLKIGAGAHHRVRHCALVIVCGKVRGRKVSKTTFQKSSLTRMANNSTSYPSPVGQLKSSAALFAILCATSCAVLCPSYYISCTEIQKF